MGGVTLRCASFLLGHWIIPFISILVVQIGTMKCFYCPQKDEPVVPWDSLPPDDQNFLRDKYPDAGQGAVCDLCIRSARPSSFFGRRSLSTSSSAPQSLVQPRLWPQGQWNLGLLSLQRLVQSLLLLPQGLPQSQMVRKCVQNLREERKGQCTVGLRVAQVCAVRETRGSQSS